MVAIIVATEAVPEPMATISATDIFWLIGLDGTIISQPGRGLFLRLALAMVPFM